MFKNIALILTAKCDLRCAHCLRGYPEERPDFPVELLPKALKEARPFGVKHVSLTGGEPHLHPQFEQVVEMIVERGYTWHFVSHGGRTRPYEALAEKYRDKLTHISISLDGSTAEVHDANRGREGAFEKAVGSIKFYLLKDYPVGIANTLSQRNKHQVDEMVKLANELGVNRLGFGGIIPTPWNRDLVLSDGESLELWKHIQEIKKENETELKIGTYSALYTKGGVNFCGNLNINEVVFNPLGEALFCCDTTGSGAVIGSLHTQSIREIVKNWIQKSAELQKVRVDRIAGGQMGEGFDTCTFCNAFFQEEP